MRGNLDYFVVLARNWLASTLDYIVMQMKMHGHAIKSRLIHMSQSTLSHLVWNEHPLR